jgi:serine/threonine-protein kinase HipA
MRQSLSVWCEGARAGTLSTEEGVWAFEYDPDWVTSKKSYALSPHFPLSTDPYVDTSDDRRTQWFFDNLLPEGGVRQALARYASVSENDSFALLQRFGHETAGALQLLPSDEQPETGDDAAYEPLTRDALRALLRKLPKVPLIAGDGRARMSLAGAQDKLALHRDGESWLLPRGGASTVIIKPANANEDFPYCPANEHFCSLLARAVGVSVSRTELLHLPEELFVIERYDRVVRGAHVERLHQIDLCQLLNLWPGAKYESEGGIDLTTAYRALDHTRQPAVSRHQFIRWFLFSYLIGNSDAHAKNVSFLVAPGGIVLAPAYDLVCVRAYGDDYDYMAMSIASEIRYGWVGAEQWDTLAVELSLPQPFLKRMRQELVESVPRHAKALLWGEEFTEEERAFLARVVTVIDQHATYMKETL